LSGTRFFGMSPRGEIAIPMGGEIATTGRGVNYGDAAVVSPFEICAAAATPLRPSAFAAGSFPSSPDRVSISSPGGDPHNLDGIADHVGGALLAFRSGGHRIPHPDASPKYAPDNRCGHVGGHGWDALRRRRLRWRWQKPGRPHEPHRSRLSLKRLDTEPRKTATPPPCFPLSIPEARRACERRVKRGEFQTETLRAAAALLTAQSRARRMASNLRAKPYATSLLDPSLPQGSPSEGVARSCRL
jgi:hypothetical protein